MNFRSTHDTWGLVTVCFHWLTAIVVFSMFAFGLWMVELTYYDKWYNTAPFIHKSTGILLLVVTLARIIWRSLETGPEPPDTHSATEKRLSRLSHLALYLVLLCVMLSGYMISTADGRAVNVLNMFEVPAIIYGLENQEDIAGDIHLALAITLIAVATLHASAAIKHHFFDNDRTLKRMLGQK